MILGLRGIFTLMSVTYFQFYSPPLSPHDLRNYRGPPAVDHWPTPGSLMDSAWEMEPCSSSTPNSTQGRRRPWPGSYMDSPGRYLMYCLVHQVLGMGKYWTLLRLDSAYWIFSLSSCALTVFEMIHFFHFPWSCLIYWQVLYTYRPWNVLLHHTLAARSPHAR